MSAYNCFFTELPLVLDQVRTQQEELSLEFFQVILIDVAEFDNTGLLLLIVHLPSLCIDHILGFLSAQVHSILFSLLQRVLVLCYMITIMIHS